MRFSTYTFQIPPWGNYLICLKRPSKFKYVFFVFRCLDLYFFSFLYSHNCAHDVIDAARMSRVSVTALLRCWTSGTTGQRTSAQRLLEWSRNAPESSSSRKQLGKQSVSYVWTNGSLMCVWSMLYCILLHCILFVCYIYYFIFNFMTLRVSPSAFRTVAVWIGVRF